MRKRETLPAEESAITVDVNVRCPRYALRTVFCYNDCTALLSRRILGATG